MFGETEVGQHNNLFPMGVKIVGDKGELGICFTINRNIYRNVFLVSW